MTNDSYRTVFVAMAVPVVVSPSIEREDPVPLGVYDSREGAEAACWRYIVKHQADAQPTRVYRFRTNNDGFTSVHGEAVKE